MSKSKKCVFNDNGAANNNAGEKYEKKELERLYTLFESPSAHLFPSISSASGTKPRSKRRRATTLTLEEMTTKTNNERSHKLSKLFNETLKSSKNSNSNNKKNSSSQAGGKNIKRTKTSKQNRKVKNKPSRKTRKY